ncbi:MAG: MFS transporter [Chloroflexi bacterium]|nr:MFS transporter [Chloroflexota bacterium]
MLRNPSLNVDRDLLAPKAFYFLFYAAAASLSPYLSLYYREAGLAGSQIGLLLGLSPLISLLASPTWSGYADSTQRHRRVLILAICGALGSVWALAMARGFLALIPAVAAFALFSAPIMALVDHAVLEMLGTRRALYPRQRLWGAVGWGVAAAGMGAITERHGLHWAFYGYLPLMFGGLLVALRLPMSQAPRASAPFWRGMGQLLGNPRWLLFLSTVFLAGVGGSAIFHFLFLRLQDLGASNSLMGTSLAVASVGEVLMFSTAGALVARRGARALLTLSMGATLIRLLGISMLPAAWLALPLQLLHGPGFSGLWTAGVAYADEMAPPGLGATAQALFGAVNMGLASSVGSLVGGVILERQGSAMLFRWAALAVIAALAVFLPSERALRRARPAR